MIDLSYEEPVSTDQNLATTYNGDFLREISRKKRGKLKFGRRVIGRRGVLSHRVFALTWRIGLVFLLPDAPASLHGSPGRRPALSLG
jgi:hypothetical protein